MKWKVVLQTPTPLPPTPGKEAAPPPPARGKRLVLGDPQPVPHHLQGILPWAWYTLTRTSPETQTPPAVTRISWVTSLDPQFSGPGPCDLEGSHLSLCRFPPLCRSGTRSGALGTEAEHMQGWVRPWLLSYWVYRLGRGCILNKPHPAPARPWWSWPGTGKMSDREAGRGSKRETEEMWKSDHSVGSEGNPRHTNPLLGPGQEPSHSLICQRENPPLRDLQSPGQKEPGAKPVSQLQPAGART